MRRRDFITLLGGAAAAWPLGAKTQQPRVPVIGYLDPAAPNPDSDIVIAFRQGLSETGHVEGRNVAIEYRWANTEYDRLPALVAELANIHVAVVVASNGYPTALAAKAATTTIPVVFYVGVDPVAFGLVSSLSRPGGNVTGITGLGTELGPKRLELLHELVPAASEFAMLLNPSNSAVETQSKDLVAAANTLGLRLHSVHASTDRDLDTVFENLGRLRVGGLVILPDGFINSRAERIAALAFQYMIPTAYQYRDFTAAGGLISYGGSITDSYRLVGVYTGRILKGEKPGDLPVQQSTKVELTINLKTAKALGITVPITLLGRADQVIE